MKNLKSLIVLFAILLINNMQAQNVKVRSSVKTSKKPELIKQSRNAESSPSSVGNKVGCKQVSTRIVSGILKNSVARDLKITLDKESSQVTIMNKTQKFTIPERKITKAGHDWVYYVNDIISIKSWSTFDSKTKKFYLFVEFEGNDSEIKGKCPGCLKRFKDRRAPDINWEGNRTARITLNPIPYNNSISFEIEKVILDGKFDFNGPADFFVAPLVKYFEAKIKEGIEKEAKKILNNPSNKKAIADALRGTVKFLGLNSVRTVEVTGENLYICD
tara:strand:- start:209 stop:1030 length:822 start_codon:yes stop_codon:yes gene_type:complete